MIILIVIWSCAVSVSDADYRYRQPEQLNDGWRVSSLGTEGLDTTIIVDLSKKILNRDFVRINSLLIVRNGAMVYEDYFNGFGRDDLHPLYSVTKSISAALIGIAIDNKHIGGVDEYIFRYFPDFVDYGPSNSKGKITIRHLLTMSSGLEWSELTYPYSDRRNSHNQMSRSGNWFEYVLSRPLAESPGSRFVYNTGTSNLLAGILDNALDQAADTFASSFLFKPLGVDKYSWAYDPQGYPCTGGSDGGLSLRPRDAAKFGYLYLNKGKWQTIQIIPENWIKESISLQIDITETAGYGYQWWRGSFGFCDSTVQAIYAMGYGGQYIFIIPELDLEIVVTSDNNGESYAYTQVYEIVTNYILKAIR